jgi:hypothetical protein
MLFSLSTRNISIVQGTLPAQAVVEARALPEAPRGSAAPHELLVRLRTSSHSSGNAREQVTSV